ncbi:hypothetical protein, partial [Frankia sp. Cas4]|uniref:hypothetical protein n=1 Tax=Frankia sp. Cas4 TaxID=3073927 RepID=UPI002AD2F358
YYDPETARYGSNDPLGLAPAPNPHTYVHNPYRELDPLSLAPYTTSSLSRGGPEIDKLAADATSSIGPGVTKASRAYQKHMVRPNASLIRLGGRDARDMSEYLINDILTNPRTALQSWAHPQFGPVYDFQLSDIGARWYQSGGFIGFLDPR